MDDRPHHPDQAMENPAPFDLNQAIHLWRERISGSPAVCHKDMDELEDHLRDATASLERRGLSAQEAFYVAQHRLGASDALQAEFGKVNRSHVWLDRALWMVLGSITLTVASSISFSMARLAELALMLSLGNSKFFPVSLVIFPIFFGVLLLLLWRWGNRPDTALVRVGRRIQASPLVVTILVSVLLALLSAMSFGVDFLTVRSVSVEQYAATTKWSIVRIVLFTLITPTLLGWLLHRVRRERQTEVQQ